MNTFLVARRREPELMDDPSLDEDQHWQALAGLRRINRWSRTAAVLAGTIARQCGAPRKRPLRVLDIACGGGDVTLDLFVRLRRQGWELDLCGCDVSGAAVRYAREQALRRRLAVRFFELDALADEIPPHDVIVNTLFLHHLSGEDAVRSLRRWAASAEELLLVSDLARSAPGFVMTWIGTRLLSRSGVVHVDGMRSIRAAYSLEEARELAEGAGLTAAGIRRHWPCRFLLQWKRD